MSIKVEEETVKTGKILVTLEDDTQHVVLKMTMDQIKELQAKLGQLLSTPEDKVTNLPKDGEYYVYDRPDGSGYIVSIVKVDHISSNIDFARIQLCELASLEKDGSVVLNASYDDTPNDIYYWTFSYFKSKYRRATWAEIANLHAAQNKEQKDNDPKASLPKVGDYYVYYMGELVTIDKVVAVNEQSDGVYVCTVECGMISSRDQSITTRKSGIMSWGLDTFEKRYRKATEKEVLKLNIVEC